MNKTDCELFKDALREGLSRRIDSIASSYEGEVLYSKKHETAMRAIISENQKEFSNELTFR